MQGLGPYSFDDEARSVAPWKPAVTTWIGLFLFLPLGWASGLCTFSEWRLSAALPVAAVLFLIGAGLVLLWPLVNLVMPSLPTLRLPAARVALLAVLAFPPLFAFALFRGGYRDLMDAHEAFLVVIPPSVLAACLWERTRRPVWFVAYLLSSLCVPFFVVNDVLSGYDTAISYLSSSAGFYVLRTLVPLSILCAGTFWLLRGEEEPISRARSVAVAAYAVAGYGAVANALLPAIYAIRDASPWITRVDWVHWPALAIVASLFWAGGRFAKFLPWAAGLEALVFSLQLGAELKYGDASFTGLSKLAFFLLAAVVAIRGVVVAWPRPKE